VNKGPTQEQLIAAQKNLTGGFVLRFDSNKKLLNYIATIAFYQLPLDYLESFPGKVSQVTVDEIKSAFQRRINTDLSCWTIVTWLAETNSVFCFNCLHTRASLSTNTTDFASRDAASM
jgi:predicted Zn-dependent peptidase